MFGIAAASAATRLYSAAATTWPGFRGPSASGVADGQDLPGAWNGPGGAHINYVVAFFGSQGGGMMIVRGEKHLFAIGK